jgi:cysteinyl-tRNA synthetase
MKLTEFNNNKISTAKQALNEHYSLPFNTKRMTVTETKSMLGKVRGLINETKSSNEFYQSQTSPSYMKLVFMEQALADHFSYLQSLPKTRIVVENEEVEKSQVVLAAQDMVDQIQKMVEEVSDMLVKELPALTSGVQSEIGVNESETFNQQVTEALTALQASLTQSKGTLQSALNGITGQGGDMAADNAFGDESGDVTADLNVDMDGDLAGDGDDDFSVDDDISVEEPEEEVPVAGAGRLKR